MARRTDNKCTGEDAGRSDARAVVAAHMSDSLAYLMQEAFAAGLDDIAVRLAILRTELRAIAIAGAPSKSMDGRRTSSAQNCRRSN